MRQIVDASGRRFDNVFDALDNLMPVMSPRIPGPCVLGDYAGVQDGVSFVRPISARGPGR